MTVRLTLVTTFLMTLCATAAAENQDPFFLSNEAALTGGSVTAAMRDPAPLAPPRNVPGARSSLQYDIM